MRNPEDWSIPCDACSGRGHVDGFVCAKCAGTGFHLIKPTDLTISQRAAKRFGLVLLAAVLVGMIIGAVLHWFKVFPR